MRLNVEVNDVEDVEDVEHVDAACIASTLPGHHLGTPNTPSRWHCAVLPDRGLKAVAAGRTRKTAVLCTFSVQQFLQWGHVWRNGTLR